MAYAETLLEGRDARQAVAGISQAVSTVRSTAGCRHGPSLARFRKKPFVIFLTCDRMDRPFVSIFIRRGGGLLRSFACSKGESCVDGTRKEAGGAGGQRPGEEDAAGAFFES